jgi:outer membrane receptor protein involved in Fe transport
MLADHSVPHFLGVVVSKRRRAWRLGGAVCTFAMCSGALATTTPRDLTELSLEDLLKVEVTSASKFAQSGREAPSSVQVITADEIRRYGWQTLAEAMRALPGITSIGDGAYTFIGTRGSLVPGDLNTRFQLLLDGQRLNDNMYEQALLGQEFPLDMEMIERIEYVPGPGSSVYGSNAMYGVINVITRKADAALRLTLSTQIGSLRAYGGSAVLQYHGDRDEPGLLLSVSRRAVGAHTTLYPDAIGVASGDGTPSIDGLARKLGTRLDERVFFRFTQGRFSASMWSSSSDTQPSTPLYGTVFNDPRFRVKDTSQGLSVAFTTPISDVLSLTTRASVQRATYDAKYPLIDDRVGVYVNQDVAVGTWASGELRLLYTGLTDHKLMFGTDFLADLKSEQETRDLEISVTPPFRSSRRARVFSVYAQDDWRFARDWRINAGVRHDSYSASPSKASPRAALIWDTNDSLTLKLLAGVAHRSPSAYERDFGGGSYVANPGLRPESIRTVEIAGEYRLGSNQLFTLALFDYTLQNLIRQFPLGGGSVQYQNTDGNRVRGLESTYRFVSRNGLNVTTSLALNDVTVCEGNTPTGNPRWVAKLRASAPLFSPALIGAFEMNTRGPIAFSFSEQAYSSATESISNLTFTRANMIAGLDAQFRVTNLFDRKGVQPSAEDATIQRFPIDGRQWLLSVRYAL